MTQSRPFEMREISPLRTDVEYLTIEEEEKFLDDFQYCKQEAEFFDLVQSAKYLHKEQYSSEFMEEFLCTVGHGLSLDSHIPDDIIFEIMEHVKSLQSLGDPTIAEVYKVSLEKDLTPFIIKSSTTQESSIIHEAFVGLYVTNKFRKYVPNFAYILGYFQCSPPIADRTGKVVNFCTHPAHVPYTIYERIEGNTLETMLPDLTFSEFVEVYMQIFYALWQFQDKFSHADIKPDNVILRPLRKRMAIGYETPFGERFVVSKYVATMIDYGNSTCVYNKINYSAFADSKGNISPDVGQDLFRLAYYTHFSKEEFDRKTRIFTSKIAKFFVNFNTTNYRVVFDVYGALPPRKWDLRKYEVHVLNVLSEYGNFNFTKKPTEELLNLSEYTDFIYPYAKSPTQNSLRKEILQEYDSLISENLKLPKGNYKNNIGIFTNAAKVAADYERFLTIFGEYMDVASHTEILNLRKKFDYSKIKEITEYIDKVRSLLKTLLPNSNNKEQDEINKLLLAL